MAGLLWYKFKVVTNTHQLSFKTLVLVFDLHLMQARVSTRQKATKENRNFSNKVFYLIYVVRSA